MERPETQAREDAGGRSPAAARRLVVGVLLGVVGAAVMAAPAGGGAARVAAEVPVDVADNEFRPSMVTITQGDTVVWTNVGSNPHNVRFVDGSFDEPMNPQASAWTVRRTFNAPGEFRYLCEQHAAIMTGTVTVNPPPGSPPPPPPPGTPPPPTPPPPSPPGTPPPGTPPGGKLATTVTLQVSDATPTSGEGVRFFGSVRPQRDGRLVRLQRRTRSGSYTTVRRIRLRDAGSSRSKFSKRLRVFRDAVFRARLAADGTHKAGTSRTRRLNVG
jgi:plastocyanin